MTLLFHPKWLFIIPAFLTSVFIVLSLIFSILKLKFKRETISVVSSTVSATLFSIISLCVVCLASSSFALFGIFFEFPVPIVAFLFGVSAVSLSNLIIEKSKSDFPFKEFIVTTLMITILLSLIFLVYLIPDVLKEPHGYWADEEDRHIHADLKIFDNNTEINLYTPENIEKNNFFHFHDGKYQKNVIHFEGRRGTLADFLKTINTKPLDDCIQKQFEKKENLYSFYVNGQPSEKDFGEYVVNDMDKLFLKCGGKPTQEQINLVGNLACIQSNKC